MNYQTSSLFLAFALGAGSLAAQTAPAPSAAPAASTTPAPATAADAAAAPQGIQFYGWVEAGTTLNATRPDDRQNFGRLFDDRANDVLLNQVVYTAEKALAPKPGQVDWGFKLQGMVGSDARFIHSLGLLDDHSWLKHTIQPDIVEAYASLHLPGGTENGTDIKAGKFVTLEGAETIDPRSMVFYSHSYLFNFGIPLNHTGVIATTHLTKEYDVMYGITRGVNTSLKDNNGAAAFHGSIAFNLGKLVGAFSTHIGPETARNNKDYRYLHDLTFTYAIDDKQSLITDLNYIKDDAAKATGYGVVEYYTQKINDTWSWAVRGEVWKDADGFYVAQFASNQDFIKILRGDSGPYDARTVGGGATTYSAITLGLHYNVPVPKPLGGLILRPEVRYDHSSRTNPFVDSTKRDQLTFGIDAVLTF